MRTELYTVNDVIKGGKGKSIEGKIIVLEPSALSKPYRKPGYQLVRAVGGFGCEPDKIGRAVYVEFVEGGEKTRFERNEIIGVLKDELVKELGL